MKGTVNQNKQLIKYKNISNATISMDPRLQELYDFRRRTTFPYTMYTCDACIRPKDNLNEYYKLLVLKNAEIHFAEY